MRCWHHREWRGRGQYRGAADKRGELCVYSFTSTEHRRLETICHSKGLFTPTPSLNQFHIIHLLQCKRYTMELRIYFPIFPLHQIVRVLKVTRGVFDHCYTVKHIKLVQLRNTSSCLKNAS